MASAPESRRSELQSRPAVVRAIRKEQLRLGRKLQALRHATGMNQEDAAEAIGISDKQLRRAELAQTNVTVGILVACAIGYKVDLEELFRRDG